MLGKQNYDHCSGPSLSSKSLSALGFYQTCQLISYPVAVSWMLAEDMTLLDTLTQSLMTQHAVGVSAPLCWSPKSCGGDVEGSLRELCSPKVCITAEEH